MKKVFLKLILALVLASMVSSVIVAPALGNEPLVELTDEVATIEKVLVSPEGTVLPDGLTFSFSIEQVYGTAVTPAPQNVTLDMTDDDLATATVEDGILTVKAQTENLLEGIAFPAGGTYVFEVKELPITTPSPVDGEMTFDTDSWLLFVQIANTETGLKVHSIIAGRPAVDESGAPILDEIGRPTATAKNSGAMTFENMFIPTDLGTADAAALVISKTATGELANLIHPFSFNLTLTAPALPTGTTLEGPIWASIVDTRGTTDVIVGSPINILESPSFTLPHGHELRVATLPVGTGFVVSETGTPEYLPSATVVAGSATGSYNAEVGEGLSTSSYRISMEDAGNRASFLNAHQETPIMGLDIASMPFILALFLSTALLAMMVATRSRKRIENLPIVH